MYEVNNAHVLCENIHTASATVYIIDKVLVPCTDPAGRMRPVPGGGRRARSCAYRLTAQRSRWRVAGATTTRL